MSEKDKMRMRDMEEGVIVGKMDKCNNIGHPHVRLWADGRIIISREESFCGWISATRQGRTTGWGRQINGRIPKWAN